MDKFEKLIKELNEVSESDLKSSIEKYKNSCICPSCPTYTECAANANEKLFCVIGKSIECITKPKGCECPNCPFAQIIRYRSDS